MVNGVIFYDHLEYFKAIWYYLWPFGIVCDHLFYFSRFGMFGPRKLCQRWIQVNFFRLINQLGFVRTLQKLAAAKEVEEKSFETLGATIAPSRLFSKSSFTKGVSATCKCLQGHD
jgi:hypothetical protein